ncbi:KamA family radical SAM protein [Botrimarina hoheduenensis]|uniref:L-lysine 2,3-aminomutase n=1 Tax=Botrimarina hoheduenensis TaxID=2528000 RepID=A0A5C5WB59_9BACT|nr:KamA family radical SAM protein [Botrimarina hoheduenensis]TWT47834.1 L-lysine 2,3-aminomutase [Botrimarina hoheduenensis]
MIRHTTTPVVTPLSIGPSAAASAPQLHREFRTDEFWRDIPGWSDVTEAEFGNHLWQSKNSVINLKQVRQVLGTRVPDSFFTDVEAGLRKAPMNIRITPYVFALIDWDNPTDDPLRKQFLPLGSQMLPDHPFYLADSLAEDTDAPVPMLTHRYPDKVLFLPLTTCPVYCSYCTRSRIIGGSTETVEKDTYGANKEKWEAAFEYLRQSPQVEDVVISGGDAFNMTATHLTHIGENLLAIPHIRRLRVATKGIAILPQKILTDDKWVGAFLAIHKRAHEMGKQVYIHTHFSSPREITKWSAMAMQRLYAEHVIVRNQAVLQAGVNDKIETLSLLTKQLSWMNLQPYYVYQHDMVPGCEHLRTPLGVGIELEKQLRGTTAGFHVPTFVCDAPGGGGKRHIASHEHYNPETGVSVWRAPRVKPGRLFLYFDPLHALSPEMQKRWTVQAEREAMVRDAIHQVEPNLGGEQAKMIEDLLQIAVH